jgi:serine/threonine-protein kinase
MTSALPHPPSADAGKPSPAGELAGYRLGALLSEDDAAIVYRAEHPALGRAVALRVLRPTAVAGDPNARRAFRESAIALARLEHPNIVTVFDFGENDETAWIASRLIESPTLQDEIDASGPLAAARAIAVVEQIADALDAVHGAGLTHRDVRPDAIWCADRHAVLGLPGVRRSDGATRLRHGGLLGDAHTLAPEQLAGRPASVASDVFALAAVFVACIDGGSPFGPGEAAEVLRRRLDPRAEPPRYAFAGDPAHGLSEWAAAALADDPESRPGSAGAAAALLRAALDELPAAARERPGALRRVVPAPEGDGEASAAPAGPSASQATRVDRRRPEPAAPVVAAGRSRCAAPAATGIVLTAGLALAAWFGGRATVQPDPTPVVAVGSARFAYDASWSAAPPDVTGPLVVALSRERVLRGRGGTAEIGTLGRHGPSVDPLAAAAPRGAQRRLVRLDRRVAVVYTTARARILVLQSADADAVVACAGAVPAARCDALAAAARLPGRALVPGPSTEVAKALAPVLLRLHNRVRTRQLGARANLARDTQALYQQAVADLSAVRVAGPDAVIVADVLDRLRAVVRAYDGEAAVPRTIGRLRTMLLSLRPLGYRVVSS